MEHQGRLAEWIMGFIPAQAVAVAAELGISDLLAAEPMTAEQLAAATHTNARALFRLLRYLASIGVFQQDENNRFNLTPMASLLRSDIEGSMRSMARIMGRAGPPAVTQLIEGIRSGLCPFEVAFGKPLFKFLSENPEEAALFDAAMGGFHGAETPAMLEAYDFSGVSILADIGCGNGSVLLAALNRYPSLRGVFFDEKHVLDRARESIGAAGFGDRCEVIGGDFFEAIPDGPDAYLLRHIIHDWEDDLALRILRNIRRVIPANGRLLVVEMIVPEGNTPSLAKSFDITMMLFPKGLERTEREYEQLFAEAGFKLSAITPTASPVSVIEGRPA